VKVISDTSPICYLLLVGQVEVLPALFERVIIPQAVEMELRDGGAPALVRAWIAERPAWLDIIPVRSRAWPDPNPLHPGEREAISLAEDLRADLVILDERKARKVALDRGLPVTGLLGILDRAAEKGLISLPDTIERLQKTSFRADPKLLGALLERHQGRLELQ
jgi:predicted nucleic acid-binding protein